LIILILDAHYGIYILKKNLSQISTNPDRNPDPGMNFIKSRIKDPGKQKS